MVGLVDRRKTISNQCIGGHRSGIKRNSTGVIPEEYTHVNPKPLSLSAADSSSLSGGRTGVTGIAVTGGTEREKRSG